MSDQKRAILAIVLSGLILFFWQKFFASSFDKQEIRPSPSQQISSTPYLKTQLNNPKDNTNSSLSSSTIQGVPSTDIGTALKNIDERLYFVGVQNEVSVNNYLKIIDFTKGNTVFDFSSIVGDKFNFSFFAYNGHEYIPLSFIFEQKKDEQLFLRGKSHLVLKDSTTALIEILLTKKKDSSVLDYQLTSNMPLLFKIIINSSPLKTDAGLQREFYSVINKELKIFSMEKIDSFEGHVKWIGIDFNYHLFAVTFDEEDFSKIIVNNSNPENISGLIMAQTKPFSSLKGKFVFSKKNYDDLKTLGEKLNLSVDFGIWGPIAVPILRGLQFFYKIIPNYGWAIIFLTILIRLLTFPLQFKSFKSMKKMELLRPRMDALKEKFKNDPKAMQLEMMKMYKESGVNPLSGCFPLLLQMPIFFALYKVLYNAVELVDAPFFWWITDLSVKDPYYILPVLMGVVMLLQQKMTPSPNMDPTQKKIMLFMPLVFSFFMKDLPSGLNLYMFISTFFGIAQQLFVYKFIK